MHALSIPTWIIHISSVVEWIAALWLIWTYGQVSQNPAWYGLSIAMLPALVSAMCACTWHFFDNPASLDWLVTLQASMTVVGNCTQMVAAWWIWRSAAAQRSAAKPSSLNAILPLPILLLLPSVFPIAKETLFAVSLFPYLGFLWFLTRSGQTPRLALIGFYALLVFVAITIPAGLYAKTAYGANLADVDWLHGGAESFLTLSNILVVLGFRQAILDRQLSPMLEP
ncbi:DUF3593 domain-containing protein [Stenomitos frigidus]|uniref:DUF3593 domain-containing protein n=1 Tax=Stenomitos frigidus TaxID=1886765 RepID=UPI003D647E40